MNFHRDQGRQRLQIGPGKENLVNLARSQETLKEVTCYDRMSLYQAVHFIDLRFSQLLSKDRSSVWIRAVSSCRYEMHSVAVHEKCIHKQYGEEVHTRGHCGLKHLRRRTAVSSLSWSHGRNLPF